MRFNPGKCEVIHITIKLKVISSTYKFTIHGQTLLKTNKAKYVGVTKDSTLSWNPRVEAMSKKVINTVAFFRNLSSCPKRSWGFLLQVSSLATAQVRCFHFGFSYQVQHQQSRSCSTRATPTTSARAALQV